MQTSASGLSLTARGYRDRRGALRAYWTQSACPPTQMPTPCGYFVLPLWHVLPTPHSLVGVVWQSFWQMPVALQTYPSSHGHAWHSCPVPFATQLVVPSARTMVHVSPIA